MKNFLFLSLAVTFFLIPFENARVFLFGVPVFFVEIGVMVAAVALVLVWKREHDMAQFVRANNYSPVPKCDSLLPVSMRWGIFFLLFGVISSTLVALSNHSICPLSHEGLLRALGIVKSWFVFPIVFGYIVFHASHTYFSREKLILAFLISFLPIPILSFPGWLFGSGMTYDGRLEGFFNSPNTFAMYLTPAVILSWYFFRTRASRPLFIICNLSFLTLLFLTRSVSAWIAIFFALFFFEIMRMRNIRVRANNYSPLRYTTIFLLFAGIVVFSQWNNPRFENFFDPDSRSSFASRLMIWESAGKMISDSPLFGIGPGNFGKCYLAYQRYFPPYLEWSVPEPHNIFLTFWLGSGFIGLCAFCFLLFRWFRMVFRRIQKEGDLLLLSLAVIMITILIHGLFDTPYWRLGLSYIFWVVFFLGIREKMINNKF